MIWKTICKKRAYKAESCSGVFHCEMARLTLQSLWVRVDQAAQRFSGDGTALFMFRPRARCVTE